MELLALRRNKTASALGVVSPQEIGIVLAGGYDGGSVAGIERMATELALIAVLGVNHHQVRGRRATLRAAVGAPALAGARS